LQTNQHHPHRLSVEQIETLVWGFVVVVVTLILAFIVIALLYSVTFVVQPIKSMAPIDMAYTKMLNDIVLLVVGGIGGVMSRKGIQAASSSVAPKSEPPKGDTTPPKPNDPSGALPAWVNPALDESWTPPPPPTTPPEHLESDQEREHLALARASND
jgi:hypothetical protein